MRTKILLCFSFVGIQLAYSECAMPSPPYSSSDQRRGDLSLMTCGLKIASEIRPGISIKVLLQRVLRGINSSLVANGSSGCTVVAAPTLLLWTRLDK